jgi:hypothetical protein
VASACLWEKQATDSEEILYLKNIKSAVRVLDPWVQLEGHWLIRRLAPDCSRIELSSLSRDRDEEKLLRAMGQETADVHLCDRQATKAILDDLQRHPTSWLKKTAEKMADATEEDWKHWRKGNGNNGIKAP